MKELEPKKRLEQIQSLYGDIKEPKYRNADPETFERIYRELAQLRPFLHQDVSYVRLVNAVSQILSRLKNESTWANLSERGMNKAIPPVLKKGTHPIELPFQWTDRHRQVCMIDKGYWGPRNYMVADVVGYFFLLKEGGNRLPEASTPLFNDLNSIKLRETTLGNAPASGIARCKPYLITDQDLPQIKNMRHWIKFADKHFRKFTGKNLSSNDILSLIHETSQVEFKLVFPVRLQAGGKRPKEKWYQMNFFSRLFEFGYMDRDIRADGVVQSRDYYVIFNTMLGELFVNNLKMQNYDWLQNDFYSLPYSAQILYRRLLLHHSYVRTELNLSTIAAALDLQENNVTMLVQTIEQNALEPLKGLGLISSWEKKGDGLVGVKFIIHKPPKKKLSPTEVPSQPS